jgi:hypothetical protein
VRASATIRGQLKAAVIMIMVAACSLAMVSMSYSAGINLSVSATVVSNSNCRFNTATSTLAFGALDPGNPSDKTVNATTTYRCGGSAPVATFVITHDSGRYETAPNAPRMRHATVTTEYLPYTITLSPSSGSVPRNTNRTLTITGTVKGNDFQGARAGNFSDTVVLTITP